MVAIEFDFPPADVEEKIVGARGRRRSTTRGAAGAARPGDPSSRDGGLARGGVDPRAHRGRSAGRRGPARARRGAGRGRRPAHRRRRGDRGPRRDDRRLPGRPNRAGSIDALSSAARVWNKYQVDQRISATAQSHWRCTCPTRAPPSRSSSVTCSTSSLPTGFPEEIEADFTQTFELVFDEGSRAGRSSTVRWRSCSARSKACPRARSRPSSTPTANWSTRAASPCSDRISPTTACRPARRSRSGSRCRPSASPGPTTGWVNGRSLSRRGR